MRGFWGILAFFCTATYGASHHPQDFLRSIAGSKDEGMQIYQHFCSNCHAQKPLINVGAPKIGDATDWGFRLKQGFGIIFKHTDEGLNGMPPRGGCFECSDKQLMLAIIAMLPAQEQKTMLHQVNDYKKDTSKK